MSPLGQLLEREIGEQPEVLRQNAERYREEFEQSFGGRSFSMVLLAARGSSDHAALYARYLIEAHLGVPVSLAAPSVWTQLGGAVKYPVGTLAVGISQSGAAPDVSEVIEALRAQGHTTVAITNRAESRLAQSANTCLLLQAGAERAVAATKTYTASLLALAQLVAVLGGMLPRMRLPDEAWEERCREAAHLAAPKLLDATHLFSLGRAYSFSTACEVALKLIECCRLPCKPYSTADFEHGPKALAGPGSAALLFGGAAPTLPTGCTAISAPAYGTDEWTPLGEAIFGQWLALATARALGLDADRPRNLSKITYTR